jgi:beta-glucosidase
MTELAPGFLWGASTAPHQIEGNNVNSDWWVIEKQVPGMQLSGDAIDSYHRYAEDMQLLADAGLNAYRFGIEWARIEPRPGEFSRAELAHYRRMITTARDLGLEPVVTLHHFTNPRWFMEEGGWLGAKAVERFEKYVEAAAGILEDVEWVCTLNEPNMLALMVAMSRQAQQSVAADSWLSPTVEGAARPVLPNPDPDASGRLIEAHHAAREVLRKHADAKVGWTVACQALTPTPGNEDKLLELRQIREDVFLQAARGDDFIGVQSYSSQAVDEQGIVPHPIAPDNTLTGNAYRPDAIGIAVRHVWEETQHTPILITENGIATADDTQRIAYTQEALRHLFATVDEGVDVRGYLHWSALDNYEWGHWEPTFGLIAVDRETFERHPKPSLAWLGDVARRGAL